MDFNDFYSAIATYPSMKSIFTVWDVLLNFLVPALFMVPIAYVYKRTHKGVTYNQVFIHTMFIMSVTVSVIMMIIGSNIARAFSLVGALSIIRFRTAIKDSKDTGYIFAAIALGMSCGTGMYLVGAVFSLLFCALILILESLKVGEKVVSDKLLKIRVESSETLKSLESIILKNAESFSLIHSELFDVESEKVKDCTYIITSSNQNSDEKLLHDLKSSLHVKTCSLFYNDQRVEI